MDAASYLSSVIEVAIGIAGFAGIIAAIRQRSVTSWPAQQLIMLQVLFFASAAAIVLSLLPAVLTEAGLDEDTVWCICGGALTAWITIAGSYRAIQSRSAGVTLPLPRPVLTLGAIAVILQVYNILGPRDAWPFLAGLIALVVNGFSMFLLLLLRPLDE